MEYLMKLIFNLIKNSRCDPFPKILVFKWCIYYFIYFSNPRETFIEFIYDKIKFKMATSNLDITFLSPLRCQEINK